MATAAEDVKEIASKANQLLADIGRVRQARLVKQGRLDARIAKLKEEYGQTIDELSQQENALVQKLVQLVVPSFVFLAAKGTKTIKLRNGEIKLRSVPESLEVSAGTSEQVVIERIKRLGGLREFTRPGKRTLNKDALKGSPRFVAKLVGVSIVRRQNLVIRPAKTQGEIVLTTDALNIPLSKEED